jgi:hypothetical protein
MLPNIVFAWWNTSLSPVRKAHTQSVRQKKIEAASNVIAALITQGSDFIALAEVDDDDLRQLRQSLWKSGYRYDVFKGTEKVGKTRFDLGCFYNPQKIVLLARTFLSEIENRNTLKLAVKVEILPYAGKSPFSIFLSHWPSPLSGTFNKASYGGRLRHHIEGALRWSPQAMSYVIAMGDFNHEPFDNEVSYRLSATRDRALAARHREFLYNPFWRHLGEQRAFHWEMPVSDDVCGSYFYRKESLNRWYTVDQMMFSSSFLSSREWYLDDRHCGIWRDNPLDLKTLCAYGFDHFPVISAVVFNPGMEEDV